MYLSTSSIHRALTDDVEQCLKGKNLSPVITAMKIGDGIIIVLGSGVMTFSIFKCLILEVMPP